MKRLLTAIKTHWPILLLVLIEVIIIAANYVPHTYLMGWDNVMPEFNFSLNFKRQISSIWEEYRGLGHIDGMAHSANLVHTVFLWLISLVIPQSMLRYTFHFLMHFLGTIGMFVFLERLFGEKSKKNKTIPLLGALFYQLNFITIQMFYAPLEAFSVHFAALPWQLVTLWSYLSKPSRRTFGFYLVSLVLFIPQYFVATLLVPVGLMLSIVAGSQLFLRKTTVKRVIISLITFFLINSFWLLPYAIGAISNASVISSAKINHISSEEIFLRNKSFGDLKNVLLLRGFSLDYLDLGPDHTSTRMMGEWRDHLFQPVVTLISYIIAGITLFGLYRTILRKRTPAIPMLIPFGVIFSIGILMLANNTVLIKDLNEFFRSNIPFFGEAFRIPFTKFSLLFVVSYTVLFTYGANVLSELFQKIRLLKKINWLPIIGIVAMLWMAIPVFKGQFFYKELQVQLPKEYLQLFEYFRNQNDQSRIVLLPAFDYWNWKYYRWGYRGSGFLWHGLPQATLDRAFDPWSGYNETFYWELSHALYSKDQEQFLNVLRKYQVSQVLFDGYVVSAGNNRSLFSQEILTLLESDAFLMKRTFGDIRLYQFKNAPSMAQASGILPNAYPAVPTLNDDRVFARLGTYNSASTLEKSNLVYPFRSLATVNASKEKTFEIKEDEKTFAFLSPYMKDKQGFFIQSGLYDKATSVVFDSNQTKSLLNTQVQNCNEFATGTTDAANMMLGQKTWLRMTAENHTNCLSFSMGDLSHSEGYLVAVESRNLSGRPLKFGIISRTAKHVEIEEMLPATREWGTTYFVLPPLAGDGIGYDLFISNAAIAETATNDLSGIFVYQFPYEELLNFTIPVSNIIPKATVENVSLTKYVGGLYKTTVDEKAKNVLLYQAFHPGWKAFVETNRFPFFKELTTHVVINNWANGWAIPSGITKGEKNIIIFFVPQFYQWLGFLLLPVPFIFLFIKRKK